MDRPACKLFSGIYTVESTATGEHRTFWVRTQPKDAEFAPGKRILALLTGTQNDDWGHYTGFAFVDDDGVHVWRSKREAFWGKDDGKGEVQRGTKKHWEEYADMVWTLALDGAFSSWAGKGYRILVEGHCLRCGRVLSTPESVRRGIGPICAEGGL